MPILARDLVSTQLDCACKDMCMHVKYKNPQDITCQFLGILYIRLQQAVTMMLI